VLTLAAGTALLAGVGLAVGYLAPPGAPRAPVAPAPADETARRTEDGRRSNEEDRAARERQEKRLAFERLVRQGDAALARGDFAAAEEAYRQALDLFPEDARAGAALADTRRSAREAAAAERARKAEEARAAEVRRLVGQAEQDTKNAQHARAVRALEEASRLAPDDAAVGRALAEARAALARHEAHQQRLAAYGRRVTAGKAALAAGRFPDALREFLEAQRILPDEPGAAALRRQAEEALAAAEDLDRRRAAQREVVRQAGEVLRQRHYDEALAMLAEAEQLVPDDPATRKAIRAARAARAEARLQYGSLVNQADEAMRAGRFEEAQRYYAAAETTLPGGAEARAGKQAAREALDSDRAARAAYGRLMAQGAEALGAGKAAEATRAFREALRLAPDDPAALSGLRDAQAAQRAGAGETRDPGEALRAGEEALRQRRYPEAARAFGDALRAAPDSAAARDGLRRARYAQAMAEGQRALRARRYRDAAAAFEGALKAIPGDPAAAAFLEQARGFLR
jgi:tetratricopeptide (TPR) repeat protein